MADPRDEMVDALLATSRAIVGIALRSLAASGVDVTLPQYRALVVLAARGPQRIVDIAAELGVNPSTGTRMCERLVRKGLIDRRRIGADRREVQLSLTEEGAGVVADVTGRRRAELARLVNALPVDSLDPALAMLRELAAVAGEPAERDFWLAWHPEAQRPDDEHPEAQHPDDEHPEAQHPDDERPDDEHPDDQNPGTQHSEDHYPEAQHADDQRPEARDSEDRDAEDRP